MLLKSPTTLSPLDALETGCTPTERARNRRYLVELAVAVVTYASLLAISVTFVDGTAPGPLKTALAMLPLIGFLMLIGAIVRFVARTDEMQRQMIVQSAAIAAGGTVVVTMALGFLENAGLPRPSMSLVWPVFAAFFGVSLPIVRRRYR